MAKKQRKTTPIDQRLYRSCKYIEQTECWEWQLSTNNIGYGLIRDADHGDGEKGGMRTTHRVSYEIHKGHIPDNKVVMHTCDNPKCCNPDHLHLGTRQDNSQDMIGKGRDNLFGSKNSRKCKYCNMFTTPAMLTRWHDENCKHKTQH